MKSILYILFLSLPLLAFGQSKINPTRGKEEMFKHRPEYPYEDVKKTGLIVVKKGMYGLVFEDKNLSPEAKKKVQMFFNQRYNGYTDLKTYTLRIEGTPKGWKIEGKLIDN